MVSGRRPVRPDREYYRLARKLPSRRRTRAAWAAWIAAVCAAGLAVLAVWGYLRR